MGGGNSSARSAQIASSITGAASTSDLLDLYASNMYSFEPRHLMALWPKLGKRVYTESSRDSNRISSWVQDHRNAVSQMLAHIQRIMKDAPQKDVGQIMLGAAYLCLKPPPPQQPGLGRDLFDALPRVVNFYNCR